MAKHLALKPAEIVKAGIGDHGDGAGLRLRVKEGRASFVFRYKDTSGRIREMGCGDCDRTNVKTAAASLTAARSKADDARKLLAQPQPVDPIDSKRARREHAQDRRKPAEARPQVAASAGTLARVARDYHERVIEPNRTDKHAAQWIQTLETHVPEEIWRAPIATLTAPAMLAFMEALQRKIPETASRVRKRLDAFFEDAIFHGLCSSNPAAALKRKLREATKGKKRAKRNFPALPYERMSAFMTELRQMQGNAARALEFLILCAARTNEVLGATWDEFDLKARTWTISAKRMKAGNRHTVYLSPRAVEITKQMQEQHQHVAFPNSNGKALSNMAMLALLDRMQGEGAKPRWVDTAQDDKPGITVHGMRSSFSTWAYETDAARREVIETTLAHGDEDAVEAAYNRAQYKTDRIKLMGDWAAFCAGQ